MIIYECNSINEIKISDSNAFCNFYNEMAFLLLKKFNVIYSENFDRLKKTFNKLTYAIPFEEIPFLLYFGVDRISELNFKENLTFENVLIAEHWENYDLFCKKDCQYKNECNKIDCLFEIYMMSDENNITKLKSLLQNEQDYEIIFVRASGTDCDIPQGYKYIGCDVAYSVLGLTNENYSIISDCLFIPKWHGCDKNGCDFLEFFNKLNNYGLFNNSDTAFDYLKYYNSFDWTERGYFSIFEIYIKI